MENLRGILLMTLSMAFFAIEDVFIKFLAVNHQASQILIIVGFSGALLYILIAKASGAPIYHRDLLQTPVLIRTVSDLFGAIFFMLAIVLIPLTLLSSIIQVMPLVVTFGAALILKESVGWRRWLAIAIGFFGVLIIIRPGFEGFQPASLLAVICVLFLSARDLATRTMKVSLNSLTVSIYGFAAMGMAGVCTLPFFPNFTPISGTDAIYFIAATLTGTFAYYLIVMAMRIGDVSVVTPFRYTRLLFAIILSMTFLGERPDVVTLIGAFIVILSGLYTLMRERRLKTKAV